MTIQNHTKVKCKKCGEYYSISPEDFVGPERYSDERNMGYEIQYTWEHSFDCTRCSNHLHITIEGNEYPEGILNYEEFIVEGCILLEKPSLGITTMHYEDN